MTDTIRQIYSGREAVAGTPAATLINYPFYSAAITPHYEVLLDKEQRGSRAMQATAQRGRSYSEFSMGSYLYFDMLTYQLLPFFGAPTTTTVDTTCDQHVFKIGSNVPYGTIDFNDANVWHQMPGCAGNTLSLNFASGKTPTCEFKYVGRKPVVIAAPGAVSLALAAYNHPVAYPLVNFKLGGVDLAGVVSGKLDWKFGRDPFHTMRANADLVRALEGEVTFTADLLVEYLADAGSFYNSLWQGSLNPGIFEVQVIDATTTIGTTTHPTMKFTMSQPRVTSAPPDITKPNTFINVKLEGVFNTTDGGPGSVTLINEIAAATLAGS